MTGPHHRRTGPAVSGSPAELIAARRRATAQAPATAAAQLPAAGATTSDTTPLVRRLAAELNVALDQVTGTGVAGRIRADDVRDAAARAGHPQARGPLGPRAVAPRPPRYRLLQAVAPTWDHSRGNMFTIEIDAYALNPLLDELKQLSPGLVQEASKVARPPTLFPTGDLPLFTASDVDPDMLLTLPTKVRHVAAVADRATMARLFQDCGGGDLEAVGRASTWAADNRWDTRGWGSYLNRVDAWRWLRNDDSAHPDSLGIVTAAGATYPLRQG